MAGHTPGPWFIGKKGGPFCVDATPEGSEPGKEDYRIAKTYASPFSPTQEQAAANARLIAASPDMLEALVLEELLDRMDGRELFARLVDRHGYTGDVPPHEFVANFRRNAISKARGTPSSKGE
jgi:hypothetical protein